MKKLFSFLLVLGTVLTSHAQQILCERVLLAPAGQPALYVAGLLQVRPDSLRLLGDFRNPYSATNPVSQATHTSLRPWQATTCDTLASTTVFNSPEANNSLAGANRHGQVLVANSLIGTPPYNDSIRVVLTLFGRNGQRRWSRVLPPAFRQESAGGVLEAPGGGFYVCGVNFLARIDSTGQLRWRRNYRFGTLLSPTYTRRGTLLLALHKSGRLSAIELSQQGDSLTSRFLSPISTQPSSPGYSWPLSGHILLPLRDGGFAAVGQVDSASTGIYRPFLVRLDQNLNVQWTYLYRPQKAAGTSYYLYNEFGFPYELADGSLTVLQKNGSSGYNKPFWLFRFSASGTLQNSYAFTPQVLPAPTCSPSSCIGYLGNINGLQPLSDSTFVLATNTTYYYVNSQYSILNYLARLKVPGLRRVVNSFQVPTATPLAARPGSAAWPAPAYPNPAATALRVPLPTHAPGARLLLTDLAGRRVRAQAVPPTTAEAELSVSGLAAGVYLLRLESAGAPAATQRITVGP
jgi:hypothetical protein